MERSLMLFFNWINNKVITNSFTKTVKRFLSSFTSTGKADHLGVTGEPYKYSEKDVEACGSPGMFSL